jgi:hypothetical protein
MLVTLQQRLVMVGTDLVAVPHDLVHETGVSRIRLVDTACTHKHTRTHVTSHHLLPSPWEVQASACNRFKISIQSQPSAHTLPMRCLSASCSGAGSVGCKQAGHILRIWGYGQATKKGIMSLFRILGPCPVVDYFILRLRVGLWATK